MTTEAKVAAVPPQTNGSNCLATPLLSDMVGNDSFLFLLEVNIKIE
jgi:hypothetical protein